MDERRLGFIELLLLLLLTLTLILTLVGGVLRLFRLPPFTARPPLLLGLPFELYGSGALLRRAPSELRFLGETYGRLLGHFDSSLLSLGQSPILEIRTRVPVQRPSGLRDEIDSLDVLRLRRQPDVEFGLALRFHQLERLFALLGKIPPYPGLRSVGAADVASDCYRYGAGLGLRARAGSLAGLLDLLVLAMRCSPSVVPAILSLRILVPAIDENAAPLARAADPLPEQIMLRAFHVLDETHLPIVQLVLFEPIDLHVLRFHGHQSGRLQDLLTEVLEVLV